MQYAMPGSNDALFTFKSRYENFIGGRVGFTQRGWIL